MIISDWISNNYIELFGAVTGILYVILEIRQNIWLWPVGIVTSAVYIWVFFTGKLYADMRSTGVLSGNQCIGVVLVAQRLRAQGSGLRAENEIP